MQGKKPYIVGSHECLPGVTWDELKGRMRVLVESAHVSEKYELEQVLDCTSWLRRVGFRRLRAKVRRCEVEQGATDLLTF